ncbi:MAG: hypothetical protein ABSG89_06940, partial [Bacteroidales bacterium]
MKKLFFIFFLFLAALPIKLLSQPTVFTVGNPDGYFSTLTEALDYVNQGGVHGDIEFQIIESTDETDVGPAVLNAPGSNGGACDYTSVKIYPTASGLTISGSLDDEPL